MGFLDKVKNMFIEEVEDENDDEVKVEKVTKEITSNMYETSLTDNKKEFLDGVVEKEEPRPIFFDDNAFSDLDNKKEEIKEEQLYDSHTNDEPLYDKYTEENYIKNNYNNDYKNDRHDSYYGDPYYSDDTINSKEYYKEVEEKEEVKEVKKIFKPTPIISPVYGVLDKNYHKEDIVSRSENSDETLINPSIDQVRNKAYGTLEDELENTLFGRNSILFNDDNEVKDDVDELNPDELTTLTDDISKELDELLALKEKYNTKDSKTKNNSSKKSSLNEDDLLNFIDSTLYKNGDEE